MSDLDYYKSLAEYELLQSMQFAITHGWTFSFDEGEHKFNSNRARATKGNHVVYDYNGIDSMLSEIHQIEERENLNVIIEASK